MDINPIMDSHMDSHGDFFGSEKQKRGSASLPFFCLPALSIKEDSRTLSGASKDRPVRSRRVGFVRPHFVWTHFAQDAARVYVVAR